MYFTYVGQLNKIRVPLEPGGQLVLRPGQPANITVTISRLDGDSEGGSEDLLKFVGKCEAEPGDALKPLFESLTRQELPEGSNFDLAIKSREVNEAGKFSPEHILTRRLLPESMQSFITQTERSVSTACKKTVNLLSWRHNLMSPILPFTVRTGENQWSLDGITWFPTPHSVRFHLTMRGPQPRDPELDETQLLLDADFNEPAGQELLREAWQHDLTNPRSALVVGFAALEIGFKEFAASLAPTSEWLLGNIPSPPVVKMLRDYLPLLPVRARIAGKVICIPKPILKILQDANERRNKVTHTSENKLDSEEVHEVLLAIQDVLWLLDAYSGHAWALNHVRRTTFDAMAQTCEI